MAGAAGEPGPRFPVLAILAAAFLVSGSAGLIHEIVWSRLLGHLFGVSTLAVSTVVAAYMGGLALGSTLIGGRSERLADARRTYAWLELLIGLYALALPLLLQVTAPLYSWLWEQFHPSFAVFSLLRLVVASALLLIPTSLMGATLPLLAQYVAHQHERRLAPQWLYTLNLIGAALGVVAAGFFLLPSIGVWGTIVVGAGLNIAVAVVVWALPAESARSQPVAAQPAVAHTSHHVGWALLGAAFLSGMLTLSTQVAWTRLLSLIVGSTTYAFSSVLLVYLVALGAGSAWAARSGRHSAAVLPPISVAYVVTAFCTLAAVYAVNQLPAWYLELYTLWGPQSPSGPVSRAVVASFLILFLPVATAGTILPLVLMGALPEGAHGTGSAVGRVYAVNTIGAIAGSLLTGFLAIPVFGTQRTLLGWSVAACAMGLMLAHTTTRPPWRSSATLTIAVLIGAGVLLCPSWNYVQLHAGVFEPARHLQGVEQAVNSEERPVYQREGRTASVMVLESDEGRALSIDARTNASDGPDDMVTQVLLAMIPILMAPRSEDVFIIGWGSGVTVGAALQMPVRQVTAVEIEPAVVEASRWFTHVNHEAFADERVRLYDDDARHILLTAPDTYDVIISEPPHPWVAGVANLFTADFYRLAAARLRADGVFAQWVQLYEMSFETYRTILATFQSVFPETLVFIVPGGVETIVVGSRTTMRFDMAEVERRMAMPTAAAALAGIHIVTPEQILATVGLGSDAVRHLVRDVPVNTDDNMLVEFRAAGGMVFNEPAAAYLERYTVPLDTMVADRPALLQSQERTQRLVEALQAAGRPVDRYEGLFREPPESQRP